MIRFLLNDKLITTQLSSGLPVLDLIRYNEHLTGTKIGCREGDCGACTVLVGSLIKGELRYQAMTSCLLPLANVHGKHVVTIEGINLPAIGKAGPELNMVQLAMSEQGATQCGFCTPGFVVSLAGYCLDDQPGEEQAIAAIDGNICRCTGYKSIVRAAEKITVVLKERKDEDAVSFAVRKKILPPYFQSVKTSLLGILNGELSASQAGSNQIFIAGGTDLYVQKPEEVIHASGSYLFDDPLLKKISQVGNKIVIGGSVTVTDLRTSELFNEAFPAFITYSKLVSSTPIRNMATVAGNFINASPIGDLTIIFLALDARLIMKDLSTGKKRAKPLREFYKGYKILDRAETEIVETIEFEKPGKNNLFHFEKVSKRTHLDIASVNTAIYIEMENTRIKTAGLSAGGVAPVPLFLKKTSSSLTGKNLSEDLVRETIEEMRSEISPISDTRGSKEYKTLLLAQLIRAHFLTLFEKTGV